MITSDLSVLATSATQSSKVGSRACQASPRPLQSHVSWIPGTWSGVLLGIWVSNKISVKSKRPGTGLVFKFLNIFVARKWNNNISNQVWNHEGFKPGGFQTICVPVPPF